MPRVSTQMNNMGLDRNAINAFVPGDCVVTRDIGRYERIGAAIVVATHGCWCWIEYPKPRVSRPLTFHCQSLQHEAEYQATIARFEEAAAALRQLGRSDPPPHPHPRQHSGSTPAPSLPTQHSRTSSDRNPGT